MLCSHVEAFTLQDMHSLMLMMCSDVPLRVTRSAFKAATPLLPSGDFLKETVILSCVTTVILSCVTTVILSCVTTVILSCVTTV